MEVYPQKYVRMYEEYTVICVCIIITTIVIVGIRFYVCWLPEVSLFDLLPLDTRHSSKQSKAVSRDRPLVLGDSPHLNVVNGKWGLVAMYVWVCGSTHTQ